MHQKSNHPNWKTSPNLWSNLAVFDLDRTLVEDNCSFKFCRYLVKKKVLSPYALLYSIVYYLRHHLFGMSLADLHSKIFKRLLKGKSLEVLESHVEPFLQDYLFKRAYAPALSQLRRAQHLGHYTLILSNSPSFLVEQVADLLGVHEWRATHYAVDKDRNLCHIASIMQGEEKASSVKEIAEKLSIDKERISAYSDSFLDLPLLLSVGEAIAVNPDRKLRRFSLQHEWSIM